MHHREVIAMAISYIPCADWVVLFILSFELTKTNVHDIRCLKDVKTDYSNCTIIGDRGYISADVQLDLFETAHYQTGSSV